MALTIGSKLWFAVALTLWSKLHWFTLVFDHKVKRCGLQLCLTIGSKLWFAVALIKGSKLHWFTIVFDYKVKAVVRVALTKRSKERGVLWLDWQLSQIPFFFLWTLIWRESENSGMRKI
jgi:hypothetical protein